MRLWLDDLLRQVGRPELTQVLPHYLVGVGAATVGALLASRGPPHPVGWLLLVFGLASAVNGVAAGYAYYLAATRPQELRAAGATAPQPLRRPGRVAGGAVPPRPRSGTPAAALAGLGGDHRGAPRDHGGHRRRPGPVRMGIGIAVLGVQLAIYAAIVHYRLYDLDRIISRTLAWGLLTVLLGGGYAAVILGLWPTAGP